MSGLFCVCLLFNYGMISRFVVWGADPAFRYYPLLEFARMQILLHSDKAVLCYFLAQG